MSTSTRMEDATCAFVTHFVISAEDTAFEGSWRRGSSSGESRQMVFTVSMAQSTSEIFMAAASLRYVPAKCTSVRLVKALNSTGMTPVSELE